MPKFIWDDPSTIFKHVVYDVQLIEALHSSEALVWLYDTVQAERWAWQRFYFTDKVSFIAFALAEDATAYKLRFNPINKLPGSERKS
jgi:hypothetical protein